MERERNDAAKIFDKRCMIFHFAVLLIPPAWNGVCWDRFLWRRLTAEKIRRHKNEYPMPYSSIATQKFN